jgi:biotin carboxyl carrier protein
MAEIRIRSEIAGRVWRIEAAAGARVEEGQTIILIESMKMEIPVFAPSKGVLTKISVNEGEEIAEGQEIALVATS